MNLREKNKFSAFCCLVTGLNPPLSTSPVLSTRCPQTTSLGRRQKEEAGRRRELRWETENLRDQQDEDQSKNASCHFPLRVTKSRFRAPDL